MKIFLFVLFIIGAYARPDVSSLSGYNYNSPISGQNVGGTPTGSYLPGNLFGNGQSSFNQQSHFGTSGSNIYNQGQGLSNVQGMGMVQDQNHVYFFAAPDEEEHHSRLRINIVPSSHKNSKVIFIKAPSYGPTIPEVIAPPSQSEDKTVVYVLVKKSEQVKPINIPASASVKQAKPEVYFVKYGSKQEAEEVIRNGLNGQALGSGVQELNNQQTFIASLKDTVGLNQGSGGNGILGNSGQGSFDSSSVISSSSGSTQGFINNESTSSNYGPPGGSGPY